MATKEREEFLAHLQAKVGKELVAGPGSRARGNAHGHG